MPFIVDRVPDTRIIRARMSHLFSLHDATGMQRAYAELLTALGFRVGTFDLLVDMTASPIQPADVVATLSDFVRQGEYQPARIAFVHADAAVKMQARRVSTDLGGRHFGTEAEALAWFGTRDREAP